MLNNAFIYLRGDHLIIYQWNHNTLNEALHLTDPENASEPLSNFFNAHGNQPIRMFINILEESYALQSIPHLGYQDRKAMIKRKQKQLFPNLKYTYSDYKGRANSERRDDLIFLSAITDEQVLKRWIQILFQLKIKVSGLFSVPLLLESFAKQLEGKQNKLMITYASNGHSHSVRQSFFKDNILALSRFKQFNTQKRDTIANEIREDVNRTQRFISRQFNLSKQDNLSVYFFCSGDNAEVLFEQINFASISLNPHFLLVQDFALLKNYNISLNCGLQAYVAAISAKKRQLKPHYQDQSSHFYYRHYLLKRGLNSASLLIFILSLLYLGTGFFDHEALTTQVDDLRSQKVNILQNLTQSPDIPLFNGFSPVELYKQLQIQQKINKQSLSPEQIMVAISQSLQAFPKIKLTKLDWGGKSTKNNNEIPDPLSFDPTQITAIETKKPVSIILQAKVDPFEGNYRYALALIESFSHHLSNHIHIDQVIATKLPVNISLDKELSGAIQKENSKIRNTFILEIQWLR